MVPGGRWVSRAPNVYVLRESRSGMKGAHDTRIAGALWAPLRVMRDDPGDPLKGWDLAAILPT